MKGPNRPAEIDAFLQAPGDVPVVLIYGDDAGLVRERAQRLIENVSGRDALAHIRLDANEIASDPGRLADEALSVPMFGGRRIVSVRNADNQRLVAPLKTLLAHGRLEALIVVEGGNLAKGAGLRAFIERAKNAVAIACYADEASGLERLIDEETAVANLSIAPEAKRLLCDMLGADRLASRAEIRKLCLYALGQPRIEIEDVETLIDDSAAATMAATIDDAVLGRPAAALRALDRLMADGMDASVVALQALRHLQLLHRLRARVEAGERIARAVDQARPPVFFRRKASVTAQLSTWPTHELERAMKLLADASANARLSDALAAPLVANALLRVANRAARLRR